MVLQEDDLGCLAILVEIMVDLISHHPGQGYARVGVGDVDGGWAAVDNLIGEETAGDRFFGFLGAEYGVHRRRVGVSQS